MSNDSLGGFYVEIGARTNQDSFKQSTKAIDSVKLAAGGLIGTLRDLTAVTLNAAISGGKIGQAEVTAASMIGVSTTTLDKWSAAARRAGLSSGDLMASMRKLEQTARAWKYGNIDSNLAKQLGHLGINAVDFNDMDPDKRLETILKEAAAMKEEKDAAYLVNQTMGDAGEKFYWYMKRSGKSLDKILSDAKASIFTTDDSHQKAAGFNSEFNALENSIESVQTRLKEEIAGNLTPYIKGINDWISKNGDVIRADINAVAKATDTIAGNVYKLLSSRGIQDAISWAGNVIESAGSAFDSGIKATADLLNGDLNALPGDAYDVLQSSGAAIMSLAGQPSWSQRVEASANLNESEFVKLRVKYGDQYGLKSFLDQGTQGSWNNFLNWVENKLAGNFSNKIPWGALPQQEKKAVLQEYIEHPEWREMSENTFENNPFKEIGPVADKFLNAQQSLNEEKNNNKSQKEISKLEKTLKKTQDTLEKAVINAIGLNLPGTPPKVEKTTTTEIQPADLPKNEEKENNNSLTSGLLETSTKVKDFAGSALETTGNAIIEAASQVGSFAQNAFNSALNFISGNEEKESQQKEKDKGKEESSGFWEKYKKQNYNASPFFKTETVNDGVITPGGHVTQVNPNDWVFAVQNLSDLARAFIPQVPQMTAGAGSQTFTISQNFTINGGENLMPSSIKEMAYNGTKAAILESMENSQRRLQLMDNAR